MSLRASLYLQMTQSSHIVTFLYKDTPELRTPHYRTPFPQYIYIMRTPLKKNDTFFCPIGVHIIGLHCGLPNLLTLLGHRRLVPVHPGPCHTTPSSLTSVLCCVVLCCVVCVCVCVCVCVRVCMWVWLDH